MPYTEIGRKSCQAQILPPMMEPGPVKIGNIFLSTEFKHVFCVLKRTTSLMDWDYGHLYKNEKGGYVGVGWGDIVIHLTTLILYILPVLDLAGWLEGQSWLMGGSRKFFQRGSINVDYGREDPNTTISGLS